MKKEGNNIIKDSSVLIFGTILAQGVPMLLQPILKRLYTPEQFGVFDLYYKILSVLVVIFALRYDISPILPKSKKKAIDLLKITIILSVISTILSEFLILIFSNKILEVLNIDKEYSFIIYVLPISTLFFVINNALGVFITRLKKFKQFSLAKFYRRTGEGAAQILFWGNSIGLYLGDLFGILLSCIYLFRASEVNCKSEFSNVQSKQLLSVAKEYKQIPKYDLIPNVLNVFSTSLLTFVVVWKFGVEQNGYLELANKLLLLPTSIISVSIGQLYLQRTSEYVRGKKNPKNEFVGIFSVTIISAVSFYLVINFFSVYIIKSLFGMEWTESAIFCKQLIISTCFSFVISPMGRILIGLNQFKVNSIWQVLKFILLFGITFINYTDIYQYLGVYNTITIILYIIYFIIILYKLYTISKVKNYELQK